MVKSWIFYLIRRTFCCCFFLFFSASLLNRLNRLITIFNDNQRTHSKNVKTLVNVHTSFETSKLCTLNKLRWNSHQCYVVDFFWLFIALSRSITRCQRIKMRTKLSKAENYNQMGAYWKPKHISRIRIKTYFVFVFAGYESNTYFFALILFLSLSHNIFRFESFIFSSLFIAEAGAREIVDCMCFNVDRFQHIDRHLSLNHLEFGVFV